MANKAQIGDLLQILHSLWPHSSPIPKGLDDERFAAEIAKLLGPWYAVLGDLPADTLGLAVKQLASSGREFFPPAGVVRQAAFDLMASDTDRMTAGEAWAEVQRALRYDLPLHMRGDGTWSSPLVQRAFEAIGGWGYFRYALEDAEMSDRARFYQAFEQLQNRERQTRRELPAVTEYRRLVAETAKRLSASRPALAEAKSPTVGD